MKGEVGGRLVARILVAMPEGGGEAKRMFRRRAQPAAPPDREGRATLAKALPIREQVQARVVGGLGDTRWKGLVRDLQATAKVARST